MPNKPPTGKPTHVGVDERPQVPPEPLPALAQHVVAHVRLLELRPGPGPRGGDVPEPLVVKRELRAGERRVQAKEALLLAATRGGATPESLAAAFAEAAKL